ncbi:hypothetical protein Tco_0399905, partial [Tanacetum coccineum]
NNADYYMYQNDPCCDRRDYRITYGGSFKSLPKSRTHKKNGNGHGDVNGNDNRKVTEIEAKKPLAFKGNEGVIRLKTWFEKMETVFHISNCPPKYQVKYASCTLQNDALTWWNFHKRTVRTNVVYAMTWRALMKMMIEVFQELVVLFTKMVPEEEDRVEKYIRGLPDNIQGNVIAAEPTRLQDAVCVANNLMDQKLKGYAARNVENKRRFDKNSRDNRVERKGYAGPLPYYNKCNLHHEGQCTMKCGNCKRVRHMTRDCRVAVATTTQGSLEPNQNVVTCYGCGR